MSTQSTAPKVFISHASEDKERFVRRFAEKLRVHGVDAWLDQWEMLPGDSLVDKIFEEAINQARAVIVVISKHSITKPWVREEINAAFVARINGKSKLIPVVIDDCEIPACLASTVYERVPDLLNFEANLHRVIMAVLGGNEKPAVGKVPAFVQPNSPIIGSLTPTDSTVFRAVCKACVEKNSEWIDNFEILKIGELLQIAEDPLCECLEILGNRSYLELQTIQGDIGRVTPTIFGFNEYLKSARRDYLEIFRAVGFFVANNIVNNTYVKGPEIIKATQLPPMIVWYIVAFFERKGWMSAIPNQYGPDGIVIHRFSPELKRWLQNP